MRPKIVCHMVSSIDGRLHPHRWTKPARGIDQDLVSQTYEEIAARFDGSGYIVGRSTMEEFDGVTRVEHQQVPLTTRSNHLVGQGGSNIVVVVDPKGKLR